MLKNNKFMCNLNENDFKLHQQQHNNKIKMINLHQIKLKNERNWTFNILDPNQIRSLYATLKFIFYKDLNCYTFKINCYLKINHKYQPQTFYHLMKDVLKIVENLNLRFLISDFKNRDLWKSTTNNLVKFLLNIWALF